MGIDQSKMSPWLAQLRGAVTAEYQKPLGTYRSGGKFALANALRTDDPSESEVGAAERRTLLEMEKKQGLPAVLNRIYKVLGSPPQAKDRRSHP